MREITRKSVRRVGDYVLTITPEGLSLRRFRSKASAKSFTWEELIELTAAGPALGREAAFAKPCPRGWVPAGGERVYVSRAMSHRAAGIVTAVLNIVPEAHYRVEFTRGETVTVRRCHLRPAPPAKEFASDRPMLVE